MDSLHYFIISLAVGYIIGRYWEHSKPPRFNKD